MTGQGDTFSSTRWTDTDSPRMPSLMTEPKTVFSEATPGDNRDLDKRPLPTRTPVPEVDEAASVGSFTYIE